ncbi:NmrA/HSCARG family protein [Segetibacter sp. 3557_3]|uniref:NmrA/HSCARG family protein n=1 Tax=Segetibacter sp. 3557_3 TaxID=2547429 RepID=UPI001058459B|nr:NmrA/HSCARG family protein [Segetibacter sp. 3557_3]TDH29054.1 NmrA/HSCARG family protein [Segetibacter sp. 3557_3]
MEKPKKIFVTGGTGNQGGAVAKSLLSQGFSVKVLTRDPSSAAAQKLKSLGASIIHGDLNKPDSFSKHVDDVDGIFSVQNFKEGSDKEVKQGTVLADLAEHYAVNHFVYTSYSGADTKTGVPHWDSKHQLETYIKDLHIPYTILRPASLMENFLLPQVKNRILKGKLVSPINKEIRQQYISSYDVGQVTTTIFSEPEQYRGRTIPLAANEMDNEQVAELFSGVLGKKIRYQKLPGLITRFVMGKDLYAMFKWINTNGGIMIKDVDDAQKEFGPFLSFSDWIRKTFVATEN